MRKSYHGQKFGMLTVVDKREVITVEKVLCKCECGNEKYVSIANMKRGDIVSCGCKTKKPINDLRGKRFGRLVVLKLLPKNGKDRKWLCLCDCGNETKVIAYNLKSGHTRSCGCLNLEELKNRFIDISGKRFGKLLAIEPFEKSNGNGIIWKCRCDCGNITYVPFNSLKCKYTKSCGCLKGEYISKVKTKNMIGKKVGNLTVISKAPSVNKRAMWNCICDCGNRCIITGKYLRNGTTSSCGCIRSRAEMNCKLLLYKHDVSFVSQKTFENCFYKRALQFDIYIPVLNICIELDGKQHFEINEFFGGEEGLKERKIRDKIKTKYCKENNIKLLRIPYTKFDNIEEVLRENNIIS